MLFLVHGIFAILAFAVFMPLGITAAAARGLLMKNGLWFKIHSYAMGLAFVFSIAILVLAVYAVNQKGSEHFHNTHEVIGLVTILLVMIQEVFAVVRPKLPHPEPSSEKETDFDLTSNASVVGCSSMTT